MKKFVLFLLGIALMGCSTTSYIVQTNGDTVPDNMFMGKYGSLQVVFSAELKKEVSPECYEVVTLPFYKRSTIPERKATLVYKVTVYNPKRIKYDLVKTVSVENKQRACYTGEMKLYSGNDIVKGFALSCPLNTCGVTKVWPTIQNTEIGLAELIPIEYTTK